MLKTKYLKLNHIESFLSKVKKEREDKRSRIFESLTDERLEFLAEAYLNYRECAEKAKTLYPIGDGIYETFERFVNANTQPVFDTCSDWAAVKYLHKLYPKNKKYFLDY